MKKHLLFALLTIAALSGCKLDDAGFGKTDSSLIIGKWYNKSTTTYTPAQNGQPANSSTYVDFTANDFLSFNTNTVTMSEGFTNTSADYKYTLRGSTLTITNVNDTETETVLKLTTDSLVLVSDAQVEANGVTTVAKVTDRYARK